MLESLLLPAVQSCLEQNGLWRQSAVLLCALSGGGDSVALLHTLAAARQRAGFTLHACYVQHDLRGQSTRQDEHFVRELCAELTIPLHVYQAELKADMSTPGIETLARERRRELFARCMEEIHGDGLLLAHHRDDQVETVLMRLLRGAGVSGLGGMRPCTPFGRWLLLRPFLSLPKAALLQALAQAGLAHREDESNQSCCTPRNTLRLKVLPRLEQLFPDAGEHIAHAARLLWQEDDCLTQLAQPLYERALYSRPPIFALELEVLRAAPEALQARLLRRFAEEGTAAYGFAPEERSLSYETTEGLRGLALGERGASMNLPCGLQALCGWRYLFLLRQNGTGLTEAEGTDRMTPPPSFAQDGAFPFAGLCFRLSSAPTAPVPHSAEEICIPQRLLARAQWRLPLPDDHIHPLGAPGAKLLRRYLTDQKVDLPFRPVLPLLADGSTVLWIPGLCTAEELRRNPQETSKQIRLCGVPPYLPKQTKE